MDYSVHVLHHRKDIWGPDAEDFRPERWENRKVGWEFLPVSCGLQQSVHCQTFCLSPGRLCQQLSNDPFSSMAALEFVLDNNLP